MHIDTFEDVYLGEEFDSLFEGRLETLVNDRGRIVFVQGKDKGRLHRFTSVFLLVQLSYHLRCQVF